MKKLINWLFSQPVEGSSTNVLLRVMAGTIFFWEGILKFVYANQGIGRFTKLGFPFPVETADMVAILEIAGGILLVLGYFNRAISLIFVGEMIVAILSTKIALYLGTSPLPLPPAPPKIGIWAVLHEVRTDYALLVTCLYLAIAGPGKQSLDYRFSRKISLRLKNPV